MRCRPFRGAFGGSVWCGSKRLRLWLQSKRELKKRLMKAVFRLPKKSQILNFNFAIIFYLTPFFCQIFFIFGFSSGFIVYLHIDMQVNKKPPAVRLKSRRSAPCGRYFQKLCFGRLLTRHLVFSLVRSLSPSPSFVSCVRSLSPSPSFVSYVRSLSPLPSFGRLTAPSLGSAPAPSLARKLDDLFESY